MPAPRKFQVGDRVWEKRPITRRCYEKEVVGMDGRSYLLALVLSDGLGDPEKLSFAKAEAAFHLTAEHEAATYDGKHRYKIIDRMRMVDVATLKRVAEVIGYNDTESGK